MNKTNKKEVLTDEVLTTNKDNIRVQYIGIYKVLDNICDRIKATPHLSELEKLVDFYIKVYELLLRGEIDENNSCN